jgi:hypothetical protein
MCRHTHTNTASTGFGLEGSDSSQIYENLAFFGYLALPRPSASPSVIVLELKIDGVSLGAVLL